MDLLELDQGVDPSAHWYYRTKADALKRTLRRAGVRPGDVKDVGAGSGFFSDVVLELYPQCTARCIDPHYTDQQLAQGTERISFAREDLTPSDLYLFMDVLEHVADDVALLHDYVRTARAGAVFFISVPAMQFLWSGHDVFLGHHRRYTIRSLEQVVTAAGLQVLSGRYLYGATFPAVAAVRLLRRSAKPKSDMAPAPTWLNCMLTRMLTAENRLSGNRIAGSTATVLAVKP